MKTVSNKKAIKSFNTLADYAQSRLSAEAMDEREKVDAEFAFIDDVMTTICGGTCADASDFSFPSAYFIENFYGKPKEKWREIWEATKHLGNSKIYKKKQKRSNVGIVYIGGISDALPIDME